MSTSTQALIIDRTVVPVLNPPPTTTPSNQDNIKTQTELLHRLHGTSLISSACIILQNKKSNNYSSIFATACCIFHRFYHCKSLVKYDVWSISMACVHLAGKVEDDILYSIRRIILCFVHLYRKRRNHASNNDMKSNLNKFPPVSPLGRIYKEFKDIIISMESIILRTLGFVLYWIPNNHPHKYILYFIRTVICAEKQEEQVLAQTAWNYCNDSCLFDICVRYEPEVTVSIMIRFTM